LGETVKREILALDLWTEELLVIVRVELLGAHLMLDVLSESFFMGLVDLEELGVEEAEVLAGGGDGLDLLEVVLDDLVELDEGDQGGLLDFFVD